MNPEQRKARIKTIRKRTGKTQNDLASEIGITASYLSMILSGQRRPSLPIAFKIAEITGIPARELVEAA